MNTSIIKALWFKMWSNCPACGDEMGIGAESPCPVCHDWTNKTDDKYEKPETWRVEYWWKRFLVVLAFRKAAPIVVDDLFKIGVVHLLCDGGWVRQNDGKWAATKKNARWILPVESALTAQLKENALRYDSDKPVADLEVPRSVS